MTPYEDPDIGSAFAREAAHEPPETDPEVKVEMALFDIERAADALSGPEARPYADRIADLADTLSKRAREARRVAA